MDRFSLKDAHDTSIPELIESIRERLFESVVPDVEGFILWLTGAVTQYDQAQSKKRGYNPNALGHYLKAIQNIKSAVAADLKSQDHEDLRKLKAVMDKHLRIPPVDKAGKVIDAFIATGKPPTYPGVKAPRRK